MPDQFPGDLLAEFRQLQRDVEELKALLRAQPGKTTASQGWIMHSMSQPDTSGVPAGGGQLYFRGGLARYRPAGNGSEVTLSAPPVAGDPGDVTALDATASYSSIEQTLINQLKSRLNALLSAMRSAGMM